MQPGRRACTATKACMQTGPIAVGYKRQEVLREESRMPLWKGLCTGCQGSTARKDGKVAHRSRTVAPGQRVETRRGLSTKMWHAYRRSCRNIRALVGCERFPVAGPGKAHGRPRTVGFVLACTNWTLVGTEAALERHERVVSVAPHMPEMEAEVAAVTLHRVYAIGACSLVSRLSMGQNFVFCRHELSAC